MEMRAAARNYNHQLSKTSDYGEPCHTSEFIANTLQNIFRLIPYKSSSRMEDSIRVLPTQFLSKIDIEREQCFLRNLSNRKPILQAQSREDFGKITLVLDLDETLVHCSLQILPDTSFVLPVVIDGSRHMVYGSVRPGAIEFLKFAGSHFEVIIYSASLEAYAEAMVRHVDKDNIVRRVLSRSSCFHPSTHGNIDPNNGAVKDLSLLQRPLDKVILVDNSPNAACLQPENLIIVCDYKGNSTKIDPDNELYRLTSFLATNLNEGDVRLSLKKWATYRMQLHALTLNSIASNSVKSGNRRDGRHHQKKAWQRAWHKLRVIPKRVDSHRSSQHRKLSDTSEYGVSKKSCGDTFSSESSGVKSLFDESDVRLHTPQELLHSSGGNSELSSICFASPPTCHHLPDPLESSATSIFQNMQSLSYSVTSESNNYISSRTGAGHSSLFATSDSSDEGDSVAIAEER